MALVPLRLLLDHAAENGYGIPAFNVNNLEQVQAIMEAAYETDSPVILQASRGARNYAGEIFLNELGIIPGIKVDKGLNPLPGGGDVETFCSGLDGLVERAAKYYEQGARFAKWRAVLQITNDGCPSKLSIQENAWGLARYARSVQEFAYLANPQAFS